MVKTLILLIASISTIAGCANLEYGLTDKLLNNDGKAPKVQFASGTRVGIVNLLNAKTLHKHVKSFSKAGTFDKMYDVDWDVPGFVNGTIAEILQSDGRYTAVNIPLDGYLAENRAYLPNLYSSGRTLKKMAPGLDKVAQDHKVDVLVIVGDHVYIHPGNSFAFNGGYGLFTSQGFSDTLAKTFGTAYAVTGVNAQVFKMGPAMYIGGGRPPLASPISIQWPDDVHNLAMVELDKVKPIVLAQVKEVVVTALQRAGLIAPKMTGIPASRNPHVTSSFRNLHTHSTGRN